MPNREIRVKAYCFDLIDGEWELVLTSSLSVEETQELYPWLEVIGW